MRRIDEIAKAERARRIVGVSVRLGALSHMSAEHFCEHFERASDGTLAEGARLRCDGVGRHATTSMRRTSMLEQSRWRPDRRMAILARPAVAPLQAAARGFAYPRARRGAGRGLPALRLSSRNERSGSPAGSAIPVRRRDHRGGGRPRRRCGAVCRLDRRVRRRRTPP